MSIKVEKNSEDNLKPAPKHFQAPVQICRKVCRQTVFQPAFTAQQENFKQLQLKKRRESRACREFGIFAGNLDQNAIL